MSSPASLHLADTPSPCEPTSGAPGPPYRTYRCLCDGPTASQPPANPDCALQDVGDVRQLWWRVISASSLLAAHHRQQRTV